jgi:hypothetical protein
MNDKMAIDEHTGIVRERAGGRHLDLRLVGEWEVQRTSRETGEPLEPLHGFNTIDSDFIAMFVGYIAGTSSKTDAFRPFNLDNTRLYITATGSGIPAEPLAVSLNNLQTGELTYTWQDHTASSYTITQVQIYNGAPADLEKTRLSYASPGWPTKLGGENWTFTYTLKLAPTGAPTPVSISGQTGRNQLIRLIADTYFGAANPWHQPTTYLQPLTVSNDPVGAAIQCAVSWPTTTASSVTWRFISATGSNNIGEWRNTRIYNSNHPSDYLRQGGCRTDGTTCGTKTIDDQFTYTYTLTLS